MALPGDLEDRSSASFFEDSLDLQSNMHSVMIVNDLDLEDELEKNDDRDGAYEDSNFQALSISFYEKQMPSKKSSDSYLLDKPYSLPKPNMRSNRPNLKFEEAPIEKRILANNSIYLAESQTGISSLDQSSIDRNNLFAITEKPLQSNSNRPTLSPNTQARKKLDWTSTANPKKRADTSHFFRGTAGRKRGDEAPANEDERHVIYKLKMNVDKKSKHQDKDKESTMKKLKPLMNVMNSVEMKSGFNNYGGGQDFSRKDADGSNTSRSDINSSGIRVSGTLKRSINTQNGLVKKERSIGNEVVENEIPKKSIELRKNLMKKITNQLIKQNTQNLEHTSSHHLHSDTPDSQKFNLPKLSVTPKQECVTEPSEPRSKRKKDTPDTNVQKKSPILTKLPLHKLQIDLSKGSRMSSSNSHRQSIPSASQPQSARGYRQENVVLMRPSEGRDKGYILSPSQRENLLRVSLKHSENKFEEPHLVKAVQSKTPNTLKKPRKIEKENRPVKAGLNAMKQDNEGVSLLKRFGNSVEKVQKMMRGALKTSPQDVEHRYFNADEYKLTGVDRKVPMDRYNPSRRDSSKENVFGTRLG